MWSHKHGNLYQYTFKEISPLTTCQWGAKHGYYIKGSGWSHSVIPALAKQYHLKCKGIGKNRSALSQALSEKKVGCCNHGKGTFHKCRALYSAKRYDK